MRTSTRDAQPGSLTLPPRLQRAVEVACKGGLQTVWN